MLLRKIIKKILGICVPELKPILSQEVSLKAFANININVDNSTFSNIVEPYRLINSKIGKGTYVSLNSKISETTIGKFCSVGPNFLCGWGIHPINALSTSPYFYSTLKQNGKTLASKNLFKERKSITIGNDVFIGANVTVLDGVNIGNGAIIGAGSVVSKDIPEYAIAYGNPIVIKKYRFTDSQREELKQIKWWDFNNESLKDVNTYFYDIEAFIKKYKY